MTINVAIAIFGLIALWLLRRRLANAVQPAGIGAAVEHNDLR